MKAIIKFKDGTTGIAERSKFNVKTDEEFAGLMIALNKAESENIPIGGEEAGKSYSGEDIYSVEIIY